MSTIELLCENCNAPMSLSGKLVSCLEGKTGKVSCKDCGNGVSLDGRGVLLVVSSGARRPQYDVDLDKPHVHAEDVVNLSGEREGAFDSTDQVEDNGPCSVDDSDEETHIMNVATATAESLVTASAASGNALGEQVPESLRASDYELAPDSIRSSVEASMEAPEPVGLRAHEDSLTPHALDTEEHDEQDGLVPLGRSFQSAPYQNERDATFRSLYPDEDVPTTEPSVVARSGRVTPHPPRAGVLHRSSEGVLDFENDAADQLRSTGGAPLVGSDDSLSDRPVAVPPQRKKKIGWIPWTVAACTLFALGVSVTTLMLKEREVAENQAGTLTRLDASIPAAHAVGALQVFDADSVGVIEPEAIDEPSEQGDTPSNSPEEMVAEPETVKKVVSSTRLSKKSTPRSDPFKKGSSAPNVGATSDPEDNEETSPEAAPPAFSASAAASSLRDMTGLAGGCRRPGDPSGKAKVVVTFASSGRVTQATISGPPFAGTPTGSCIAQRFRTAQVPPFQGKFVTVTKTVTIR